MSAGSTSSRNAVATAQPAKASRTGWWVAGGIVLVIAGAAFVKRGSIAHAIEKRMPIAMLESRVLDHPDDYMAADILCKRLVTSKESKRALKTMRKVTEKPDASGDLWLLRADMAQRAGEDRDAAKSAETALKSTSHPANAHYVLGVVATRSGKEEEGQAEFQKAVSLDPRLSAAWIRLGRYSVRSQYRGAAIDQFQHALAASPRNYIAATGLAEAYYSMGQFREAEQSAKNSVVWQPKASEGHLWLARIMSAQDRYKHSGDVEREYKEAIRLSSNPGPIYRDLGKFYLQQDDLKSAAVALQNAIKQDPLSKASYPLLIQCDRKLGRTEEVAKLEKKYHELAGADIDYKWLEQQVWQSPKDVPLRISLVKLYIKNGRTDLAKRQADQLRMLAPQSPAVKALLTTLNSPSGTDTAAETPNGAGTD